MKETIDNRGKNIGKIGCLLARLRSINSEIAYLHRYRSFVSLSLCLSLSALVDNARRKMKGVGVAAKAHQVPGLPLEEALTAFPVPIFGSGPHRGKLQKPILRK